MGSWRRGATRAQGDPTVSRYFADRAFNARTRTDDHGLYLIERVPFGKGYGKVTTPDFRGAAPEFVAVNQPEIKVIFKL